MNVQRNYANYFNIKYELSIKKEDFEYFLRNEIYFGLCYSNIYYSYNIPYINYFAYALVTNICDSF